MKMRVYTVQDYDTIEYAGTSRTEAQSKVRGSGCVVVWENGKVVGYIKYENDKWVWKVV